jgi:exonuclease III
MRLITSNIRSGGSQARTPALGEMLLGFKPDVLVITEFRLNRVGDGLVKQLTSAGLEHCAFTSDTRGVLIAARQPFEATTNPGNFELYGDGILRARFDSFDLLGVYMPQKEKMFQYFDYLIQRAESTPTQAVIAMGDFNTGRNDIDIEQNRRKQRRVNRYFAAQHFLELETHWTEAWRYIHPEGDEYSWYARLHRQGGTNGWRLDHCFVSGVLRDAVHDSFYVHEARLAGLTDHSALVVDIAIAEP